MTPPAGGAGIPMAFPPDSPGPDGRMAQTFPHVADQLLALARKVQGERLGPLPPTPRRAGGAGVASYFPAPEDKVARIHPGLAGQLAAIASRVAKEDTRKTTGTLQQRTFSPRMPPEPMTTAAMPVVDRELSSSYSGSEMSSSLESMPVLSRESVRQMGFQHPVNRWVHIKQGPGASGPAPTQRPTLPTFNNGRTPPGPRMAAYDMGRF